MKDTYELLKALGGKGGYHAPDCFGKDFRKVARTLYEMNAILNVMAQVGKPMRVKEICAINPGTTTATWVRLISTSTFCA